MALAIFIFTEKDSIYCELFNVAISMATFWNCATKISKTTQNRKETLSTKVEHSTMQKTWSESFCLGSQHSQLGQIIIK